MTFFSDFGIQPILLAAQVVNFFILLFILKKFLYKPILKILEERKSQIAQSLKSAEEIEKRLQAIEGEREKVLAEVSKEGDKILALASKESQEIIEMAKEKATKEAEKILESAQKTIVAESAKMRQEIKDETADLVVLALEKVLSKNLSAKDKKELTQKSIKEIV